MLRPRVSSSSIKILSCCCSSLKGDPIDPTARGQGANVSPSRTCPTVTDLLPDDHHRPLKGVVVHNVFHATHRLSMWMAHPRADIAILVLKHTFCFGCQLRSSPSGAPSQFRLMSREDGACSSNHQNTWPQRTPRRHPSLC